MNFKVVNVKITIKKLYLISWSVLVCTDDNTIIINIVINIIIIHMLNFIFLIFISISFITEKVREKLLY